MVRKKFETSTLIAVVDVLVTNILCHLFFKMKRAYKTRSLFSSQYIEKNILEILCIGVIVKERK